MSFDSRAARTVALPEIPVWSLTSAPASSSARAVILPSKMDSVNSFDPTVKVAPASSRSPLPAAESGSESPPQPAVMRVSPMAIVAHVALVVTASPSLAVRSWRQGLLVEVVRVVPLVSPRSQQVLRDPGKVVDEERLSDPIRGS